MTKTRRRPSPANLLRRQLRAEHRRLANSTNPDDRVLAVIVLSQLDEL